MKTRKPSTVRLTTSVLTQVATLYPHNDPIRLTAGFLAFGLPMKSTLLVLKRLAPRFKHNDIIRLAAGFNELRAKIKAERNDERKAGRHVGRNPSLTTVAAKM